MTRKELVSFFRKQMKNEKLTPKNYEALELATEFLVSDVSRLRVMEQNIKRMSSQIEELKAINNQ